MAKKMTMADIANLSGVGKSTVSRYFNGGYVKDETRAKIQKVIEEYNYTPNAFARLNAKQSNVIGVVVPTLNSKITSRVITSIDRYLREKGYTTLIQNSDHDIDQELQNIQRLIQLNVDGILISSIAITKDHKELLKKAGIPVVVLTQDYEDGISIIYDDYHAGKTIGEYIGKKGHQKVGYIGVYETDQAVGIERRNGVLDGLKEYGITPVEEFSSFRRIFYFSVFPLSAMVRFTSALYASVRSTKSLRGLEASSSVSVSVIRPITVFSLLSLLTAALLSAVIASFTIRGLSLNLWVK